MSDSISQDLNVFICEFIITMLEINIFKGNRFRNCCHDMDENNGKKRQ
jgi:hypothetical protein